MKEIVSNHKSFIGTPHGPVYQKRQAIQKKKRNEESWHKLTSIIAK